MWLFHGRKHKFTPSNQNDATQWNVDVRLNRIYKLDFDIVNDNRKKWHTIKQKDWLRQRQQKKIKWNIYIFGSCFSHSHSLPRSLPITHDTIELKLDFIVYLINSHTWSKLFCLVLLSRTGKSSDHKNWHKPKIVFFFFVCLILLKCLHFTVCHKDWTFHIELASACAYQIQNRMRQKEIKISKKWLLYFVARRILFTNEF